MRIATLAIREERTGWFPTTQGMIQIKEFELVEARIENLRGFFSARFPLNSRRTVLVGPNNSGKTSILRLLRWALNELDQATLAGAQPSEQTLRLLLPARDTQHRARRLALGVKVRDGRRRRKYRCNEEGITQLRLNVRLTPKPLIYAKIGPATRGETPSSDPVAIELLNSLRAEYHFMSYASL